MVQEKPTTWSEFWSYFFSRFMIQVKQSEIIFLIQRKEMWATRLHMFVQQIICSGLGLQWIWVNLGHCQHWRDLKEEQTELFVLCGCLMRQVLFSTSGWSMYKKWPGKIYPQPTSCSVLFWSHENWVNYTQTYFNTPHTKSTRSPRECNS